MARVANPRQAPAAPRPVPAPANAPRRRTPHRGWLLATTALLPIAAGPVAAQTMPAPGTGPTGGQVVAGQAAIGRTTNTTTITQTTGRAAIDWQQFNVGSQHTVQFVQPGQSSWTLNRVVTPDPSVIAGRVQANGGVAIVNQSGVLFAQGAQVNVGSLIASAAGITNENFMAGRMVFDQAPRPGARVENHGSITVADRGLAALVAPGVSNSGVIRARLGRVALGAAETFVLDLAGDGLIGIDVTQAVRTAPEGGQALVTNAGVIEAQGGSVLITAHAASGLVEDLVRHTGTINVQAVGDAAGQVALRAEGGSLRVEGAIDATGGAGQRGGAVALQATGGVTVASTARVDASGGAGGGSVLVGTTGRGRSQTMARRTTVEAGAVIRADATQSGTGGEIVVNSAERTEMRGTLSARGGEQGGNGGFIEVSGQQSLLISGFIDLDAPAGTPGELLIDPTNIIVSTNANVNPPGPANGVDDNATTPAANFTADTGGPNSWLRVDPGAIEGFTGTVTLNATNDIVVDSAVNKTNGGLGLLAGQNLTIGAAVSVSGTLTLAATAGAIDIGANLRAATMNMTAGTGIAQTGGTIAHVAGTATALPLSATTLVGGIALNLTGNGALSVTFSAPGAVAIRSGNDSGGANAVDGALTVAGNSTGGTVLLASERANAGSTAGTLAIDASVTSAAGITLAADGGITQGAAGALITARDATGILRIRNRTDGAATAAASATLTNAANRIAVLDARTTGALAVTSAGFAASGPPDNLAANPTMSVTLAAGGSVSLAAPRLALPGGTVATTGDVTLVATEAGGGAASPATLTIGGAVRAGNDATVRLRADRMALTGASFDAATTSLAALEVGPLTAGRAVFWGGADAGGLLFDAGSRTALAGADAATLRLGRTTVDAAAVTAGDITFGEALTFAGTLALAATGAITQTATSIVTTPSLFVDATGGTGSLNFVTALNVIGRIDAQTAGGLALRSGAATLTVDRATSGGTLGLESTGTIALGDATVSAVTAARLVAATGITQGAAGALSAPAFAASTTTGNIALAGSGNAIGSIVGSVSAPDDANGFGTTQRGLYAGGTIALATSGDLTVAANAALEARGGSVDLTAGGIAIGAQIGVFGGGTPTLVLTADGSGGGSGDISQTARVRTTAIDLTASGNVTLTSADNVAPSLLASSAGGTFALTTSGGLTVGGAVSAADALQLTAQAGTLAVNGALTLTNGGLIALNGADITQSALIRARDAGATSGGTVSLTAGGGTGTITQSAGGRIVADDLTLFSNGDVNLRAGLALGAGGAPANWNAVSSVLADVIGNFSLLNAGDLFFQGPVFGPLAGSSTSIVTSGALTLGAGALLQTGTVALAAGGGITILGSAGTGTTGIVTLATNAGGTITQGGAGAVNADVLRIITGGDVTLAGTGNVIDGISAAALSADVGINVRSSVGLTTLASSGTMLLPNNTFVATPDGIVSNDITLQAPSITIVGSLVRFDTNQAGSVTLITDSLNSGGGEIDLGVGGTFGIGFDNPNVEILVGDPVVDTNIVPIPGSTYVIAATPVTGPLTQWISGTYINTLPLSAGTVNATLRIGSPDQTARTFVIGPLAPNARFTTFDLLGGNVVVGANITSPGQTVNIAAGANVLASGTYLRDETRLTYDIFLNPIFSFAPNVVRLEANGVITAGRLIANAGTGNVNLNTVAHDVDALSGSAGGTFSFRDADGFVIGPAGSGGIAGGTRVVLQADAGSITQAAGSPVVTPRLEANVPGGSLVLDGGSAGSTGADLNQIGSLTQAVFPDFSANGGITIRNAGSLFLDADMTAAAGDVRLHAQTGSITQGGDGAVFSSGAHLITANTLFLSTPGGSALLTNGAADPTNPDVFGNVLGSLGASTIAGDFILRTAQTMTIAGPILVGTAAGGTAGTTTLLSRFGDIIQGPGGSLATDALRVVATGGGFGARSLLFNAATANAVGTVLDSTVSGDFALRTSRTLLVEGNITAGAAGRIELEAPGITLGTLGGPGGTLTANRVLLRTGADFDPATGSATGGSILQNAGTIETTQFSASAPGGDITLAATGNTFGTIVAGADADGTAAGAGIVAGGNVSLTTDGTLALTSPLLAGWDPARAGVTVTLTANQMALNALVDTRGPGGTNRQGGTIAIAPLTAANPIVLGGIQEIGGTYLTLQGTELANLRAGTVSMTTASAAEGIYVIDTAALAGLMTGGTTLNLSAANGFVEQFAFNTGIAQLTVERLNVVAGSYANLASASNLIAEVTGLSAAGFVSLASASPLLTLSGPVATTLSGGTITIRANDLAIPAGGAITVPNGIVDIAGVTAGRAISLGTEVANTLGLSSAEIGRIGQTASPLTLVRIGTVASGTISLQGDVAFRDAPADASGAVGGVRALALELRAAPGTSDILQTGAGGINIATVSAAARQVSLGSADNAVDRVGFLTAAAGGAALRSLRDLTLPTGVTASAAGGTLALTSDGTLLVQGAATATGAAGDVALTGRTGLAIDQAAAISAARDVALVAGPAAGNGIAALTIDGTVSAGGSIAGSATGTLTVRQDMTAAAGNITLSTLSPGTQPDAAIVIAAPVSATPNLAPGVAGVTELRAAAGTVSLTATGAVQQDAAGTQIIANALAVSAGQNVDLGVGGNQVVTLQSLSAAGSAELSVGGPLVVAGAATAVGSIDLASGATLTVSGTGSVAATGPGSSAALTGATGVTVAGSVSAEDVTLTATTGQVAVSGGTVSGGGAGTGGTVTLAGTSILVNGGATVTGETITGTLATGPITIDASTVTALGAAGVLSLTTGGALAGQGAVSITNATVGGATTTLAAGAGGLAVSGTGLTAGAGGASLNSLGTASITGGTTTVTGGGLTLSGATGVTVNGGTHQAGGNVAITAAAGAALVQNGTVRSTGGDVGITGTTATVALATLGAGDALSVTATAGAAGVSGSTLTAGAGGIAIGATGGAASLTGGTTTVAGGGGLGLTGTIGATIDGGTHTAAGTISLAGAGGAALVQNATLDSTGGGVTLSGTTATIANGTTDADGTISLTATAGAASVSAGALTAGADIALTGTTLAQIAGGTHQAGGSVTLSAAAATIAATVDAGADVALTATTGNAIITGGAVTAGGDITLQGQALARITGGTHGADGGVQVTSAGGAAEVLGTTLTTTTGTIALSGTSAQINAATVDAGGSVTLAGTAGTATITGGGVTAGADIALTGQTGASVTNGTHTAGQDVSITAATGAAQAVTTTLEATAGTLSITGPAATMNAAALSAGTAIAMTATGGDVTTTNGSLASGGAITLQAAGLAVVSGTATTAAGATGITGAAGVRLVGGVHGAGLGFTAASAAGTAELTGTTITTAAGAPLAVSGTGVTLSGGTLGAGGDMSVTATAGGLLLAVPTLTSGGTMALAAPNGAVTFQAGTTAQAGTDLTVLAGALAVNAATLSAGQDIAMTVGGGGVGFTDAVLAAGRDIRLDAGSAATITRGKFDAVNEIVLDATAFTLNQANIDPINIFITADGNMVVDLSTITADEAIRLVAGGTITVRNSTITGNSVGIESNGALSLDGGLFVVGDVLVFASPTSITTTPGSVVTITPRGTLLPGVAFDTRAAGSLPDPLDVIVPDSPLLPANQQETQVRIPGTNSPGSFGPPDADPAGTLNFSINAGRSAIFLLIDGGNATGTIETGGRVGVFGLGGTVDLFGTLIDFNGNRLSGGAASALTDSARPGPSNQLTRFRFNGCVISSINCFIPTQIVTIPQAPPQQVDIRLWGSRITDPDVQIPNVAEEDY